MRGRKPWYASGLLFACRKCNNCCTGEPGYVWVSKKECRLIAEHLGMERRAFRRQYTRSYLGRISLKEYEGGDCCLLTQSGCRIYPVRPAQCRAWPFWPSNMKSAASWTAAAERCPGVGSGRKYLYDEIKTILADMKKNGG